MALRAKRLFRELLLNFTHSLTSSSKNFEAELRGRELVVEQLKEAGTLLLKDAELHENSDRGTSPVCCR